MDRERPSVVRGWANEPLWLRIQRSINYFDTAGEVRIPLIAFAVAIAIAVGSDAGGDPNSHPTGFLLACAGPAIDAAIGFAIGKVFGRSASPAASARETGGARVALVGALRARARQLQALQTKAHRLSRTTMFPVAAPPLPGWF